MTGAQLRELRHRTGMNQTEFGRQIGYSINSIKGFEASDKIPLRAELACSAFAVGILGFDDVDGHLMALSK